MANRLSVRFPIPASCIEIANEAVVATAQIYYGGHMSDYQIVLELGKRDIHAKVVRSSNQALFKGKPVQRSKDLDDSKYRAMVQLVKDMQAKEKIIEDNAKWKT